MAFAEEQAQKLHLHEIRLYTNIDMTENLVFYPKLGYEKTESKTENGYNRVYFRRNIANKPKI